MYALQVRKTTATSLGLKGLEEELRQRHYPRQEPGFLQFQRAGERSSLHLASVGRRLTFLECCD